MYTVYWLIAVAVFLLLEILTLGLTSIWFAVGSLAAAIGAGLGILAAAVSCIVFVFARPWAQKYLNSKTEKTNAESLIGKTGIVKKRIINIKGQGMVYIQGMDWTARSADDEEIPEETEVIVEEIKGVKLIVSKK
nr:NfeD family protein [uncultured Anaerostipes sp.]